MTAASHMNFPEVFNAKKMPMMHLPHMQRATHSDNIANDTELRNPPPSQHPDHNLIARCDRWIMFEICGALWGHRRCR